MIRSLYENPPEGGNEMVKEYMLRVHEAVAVVKHAYPDQVPNEGEGPEKGPLLLRTHPQLEGHTKLCYGPICRRENKWDTSFDTL